MHAEILATGSELLLGEVVDTNSTFIARQLRDIGLNLYFKTVVGDNEQRMTDALLIALGRSDVIITTGGLGPTVDDVTRPAVARAVERELMFREDLLDQIKARFRAYNAPMGENNRRQAYIPAGAIPIENPVGTAPAFIVEHKGKIIISLPGVPREMEYLIEHSVLPYLQTKLNLNEIILIRTLHTVGVGESRIDEAIGELETAINPTVGLSAKAGQVDIRITAKAATRAEAETLNGDMERRARERLNEYVFGADDDTLEGVVAKMLADRQLTLASVETGTGGLLAGRLAGIGSAFRGGLTVSILPPATGSAANNARQAQPAQGLAAAIEAAHDVRVTQSSDLGLAAIVRPAPDGKGLQLFVAYVSTDDQHTIERGFGGHTALAAQWASTAALGLVWRRLRES